MLDPVKRVETNPLEVAKIILQSNGDCTSFLWCSNDSEFCGFHNKCLERDLNGSIPQRRFHIRLRIAREMLLEAFVQEEL